MTRIAIIAIAALLVLGVVGTTLSRAQNRDPGPAIMLEKEPTGGNESGQDKDGGARAEDDVRGYYEDAAVSDDRDDGFTVAHPQPVGGGNVQPDDDGWDDDGPGDDGRDDDGPDDDDDGPDDD